MTTMDRKHSTNALPSTTRLARRGAGVMLRLDWQSRFLKFLPWFCLLALILIISQRVWIGDVVEWWGILLVCTALCVAAGGVVSWVNRVDVMHAAGWIDENGSTQSKYRSALELSQSALADPSFRSLAIDAAEHDAQDPGLIHTVLESRKRATSSESVLQSIAWSVLPLLASIVLGIWLPSFDDGIEQPPKRAAMTITDAQSQIEQLADGIEESVQELIPDEAEDELIQDALEDLESLEQELASADADVEPESNAARAASRVEQLADELDQRSVERERQDQALRERLDNLRSEDLSNQDSMDRFREQLSQGRYEEAIEELDSIQEQLDSMTDAQREQVAREFEELSRAIDPESQESSESSEDERLFPPDENIDQAESSPAPPEDTSKSRDLSEEISDSLKEQAEEIRQNTPERPEPSQDETQQQPDSRPSEQSETDQKTDSTDMPADSTDDPANEPTQEPVNEPGSQTDRTKPDPSAAEQGEGEKQEPREGSEGQSEKQSETSSEQEGQRSIENASDANSQQQPQDQGSETPTDQESPTSPSESQQQQNQPQDQSQEQQNQEPGQGQGDPNQQNQTDSQKLTDNQNQPDNDSSLRRTLKEAQRRSDQSQQDRKLSERLREQLDQQNQNDPEGSNSSSESGEQYPGQPTDQSADQSQRDTESGGGDSNPEAESQPDVQGTQGRDPQIPPNPNDSDSANQEFVPIQAGDDQVTTEDSTPIGKWYNPDSQSPKPGSAPADTASRFRKAAEQAREQIDDRRVPKRYRNVIRQYFKQLDERASELAPATPGSDGADAPDPSSGSTKGSTPDP